MQPSFAFLSVKLDQFKVADRLVGFQDAKTNIRNFHPGLTPVLSTDNTDLIVFY
jgi:hypothetical protein